MTKCPTFKLFSSCVLLSEIFQKCSRSRDKISHVIPFDSGQIGSSDQVINVQSLDGVHHYFLSWFFAGPSWQAHGRCRQIENIPPQRRSFRIDMTISQKACIHLLITSRWLYLEAWDLVYQSSLWKSASLRCSCELREGWLGLRVADLVHSFRRISFLQVSSLVWRCIHFLIEFWWMPGFRFNQSLCDFETFRITKEGSKIRRKQIFWHSQLLQLHNFLTGKFQRIYYSVYIV